MFNVTIYLKSGQTIQLRKYKHFKCSKTGQDSVHFSEFEWERGEHGTPTILSLPPAAVSAITYEEA